MRGTWVLVLAVALASCAAAGSDRSWTLDQIRPLPPAANTAARMRALLGTSVAYGGLWFRGPDCQREFIAPRTIGPDQLDAFARCLVTLHLRPSARKDALPDVVVYTDGEGFEIEAEFVIRDRPQIAWIGFSGRHGLRDALPTITPGALARLRIGGGLDPALSPDAEAQLARARGQTGLDYSAAWVKLCIDGQGAVTGAHVRAVTSPVAARAFADAARAWKLRPFVLDGRALPVCALLRLYDPDVDAPDGEPEELPWPMPADLHGVYISAKVLHRQSGNVFIGPPDRDKVGIATSHYHETTALMAMFAFCIDDQGKVMVVRNLRPSGSRGWDEKILSAIRSWRYRPLMMDGVPHPACTTIKFIYTQRD